MCRKKALKVGVVLSNGELRRPFLLLCLKKVSCAQAILSPVYITPFDAFERQWHTWPSVLKVMCKYSCSVFSITEA